MKNPEKMVVWTANIDKKHSRRQGRRISKALSIESPRFNEIEKAAKTLSYDYVARPGSSRPSSWWEKTGFLLIERKAFARAEVLRTLAKQVAKDRVSGKV